MKAFNSNIRKKSDFMNFVQTLKENNLYLTDYTKPTLVDAVRATYNLCGKNFFESDATTSIKKKLNKSKHILFILSDGMGTNLINCLSEESILKRNKIMDLQTVNPSTTGCAIPSALTGEYPSTHGMLGWLSYNRERNIEYLPVLFMERNSGKDLNEFGIRQEKIYQTPSALNTLDRKAFAMFPDFMVDSPFSSFASCNRIAYKDICNAFEKYSNEILTHDFETYTYMYIPDVDSNEHRYGVYSKEVFATLKVLEDEIAKLTQMVSDKDLEIIITADHGQVDVTKPPIKFDFEKYRKFFYALPGIDSGTATYYVKEECKGEFEREFRNDYANKMFLFDISEAIDNKVFGNEPLSAYMKNNLGEYISFCKKGEYFINSVQEDKTLNSLKGTHSGFSTAEVIIPLIVIK